MADVDPAPAPAPTTDGGSVPPLQAASPLPLWDPRAILTHRSTRHTAAIGRLAMAKAAAAGEFLPVVRDKFAEIRSQKANYDYSFADLATVIAAVTPALSKHGLALFTPVDTSQVPVKVIATIKLVHGESEQWIEQDYEAHINDEQYDPRKVGSASTYARRYGTLALLGIAPADEDDDDGAAAGGDPRKAVRGVERPNLDEHPNAPPPGRDDRAPAKSQQRPAPEPSRRTSEPAPAPPAAETTRTIPFETKPTTPSDDAFWTMFLAELGALDATLGNLAGWQPDDVLETWATKLSGVGDTRALNALSTWITLATKHGAKSTIVADVAKRMRDMFTTRNGELRQAAKR